MMYMTVSSGCFEGTPLDFANWRLAVGIAAGYNARVWDLEGTKLLVPDIDVDVITMDNILGIWDVDPEDIILVLLAHCDYEGCIYPNHFEALIDRLNELSDAIKDVGDTPEQREKAVAATKQFIAGLKAAAEKDVAVVFSCEDM